MLDDLADYLTSATSGAIGTLGVSLFKGYLPEGAGDADRCIALYETGGLAPIKHMGAGPNTSVVERPRVQVVCRAEPFDYATARADAHTVYKLLDGLPTRTINGVAYKWGAAVQSPLLVKQKYDTNNRPHIACNYDITKEVSA